MTCPCGWFLYGMAGRGKRRPFLPYASYRWLSQDYDPDPNTWQPIHEAYGFTTGHAAQRAKRKAGPAPCKPTAQGVHAPGGGEALPSQGQSEGTP